MLKTLLLFSMFFALTLNAVKHEDCRNLGTSTRAKYHHLSPILAVALWDSGALRGMIAVNSKSIADDDAQALKEINNLPPIMKTSVEALQKKHSEILKKLGFATRTQALESMQTRFNEIIETHINSNPGFTLSRLPDEALTLIEDMEILNNQFHEIPKNPIARWLQQLFVSHLSGEPIPTYYRCHPISDLANDPELRAANAILQTILDYQEKRISGELFLEGVQNVWAHMLLNTPQHGNPKHQQEKHARIHGEFREIFGRELPEIPDLIITSRKKSRQATSKERLSYLRYTLMLSHVLKDSLDSEASIANTQQRHSQIYPENMTILGLLTFLVARLESPAPLFKLSAIMEDHAQLSSSLVTEEEALKWRSEFSDWRSAILDQGAAFFNQSPIQAAEKITIAMGMDSSIAPEGHKPILYRKVNAQGARFYNCGETTVLNVLLIIFYKDGKYHWEVSEKLGEFKNTPYMQGILSYLKKHRNHADFESQSSHNEWADLMSRSHDQFEETPVIYGKPQGVEIHGGGIVNFLNKFAQITHDDVLRTPWPNDELEIKKMAYQKLKRLCDLFCTSKEMNFLSIYSHQLKFRERFFDLYDRLHSIFTTIVLSIQGVDIAELQMDSFHFDYKNCQSNTCNMKQLVSSPWLKNHALSSLPPSVYDIMCLLRYSHFPFPNVTALDRKSFFGPLYNSGNLNFTRALSHVGIYHFDHNNLPSNYADSCLASLRLSQCYYSNKFPHWLDVLKSIAKFHPCYQPYFEQVKSYLLSRPGLIGYIYKLYFEGEPSDVLTQRMNTLESWYKIKAFALERYKNPNFQATPLRESKRIELLMEALSDESELRRTSEMTSEAVTKLVTEALTGYRVKKTDDF